MTNAYKKVALVSLCGNIVLVVALVLAAQSIIGLYSRSLDAQRLVEPSSRGLTRSEIVFIGDSRVHQWAKSDAFGARYIGYSGATASQIAAAVISGGIDLTGASEVYLQLGVNDLRLVGVRPSLAGQVVAETKKWIDELARYLAVNNVRVTIITVFPTGPVRWIRRPVWSSEIEESLGALNRALLAGNRSENVRVLDVTEVFNQLGSAAYVDELHVTGRAYEKLNKFLVRHR